MYHNKVTFPTKGYARIFCHSKEDVEAVKDILKAMDEEEFDDYCPNDLITSDKIETAIINDTAMYKVPLCYTHKYDEIDLNELQLRCFLSNISIAIWNNNRDFDHSDNDMIFVPVKPTGNYYETY